MTKPLKVLVITSSPTTKGGISEISNRILNSRIPEVKFLTLYSHTDGTRLVKLRCFLRSLFLSPFFIFQCDICHIHFSERASFVRKSIFLLISKTLGKTVLMHSHGADFQEFYNARSLIVRKFISFILSRADAILVLSNSWKLFFENELKISKNKIHVLMNPTVQISISRTFEDHNPFKVLFLGSLIERKGVQTILASLGKLEKNVAKNILILFAGEGNIEYWKKIAADHSVENFTKFLGWIGPLAKKQLLLDCDAFILPSFREGVPLSTLEAMGAALPIVCSDIHGHREILDDSSAIFVKAGNEIMIANALVTLMENADLRKSLGNAAFRLSDRFSEKNFFSQLHKLYCILGK